MWRFLSGFLLAVLVLDAGSSHLDDAAALQKEGKLQEARVLYHAAAVESRGSAKQRDLATALSGASRVEVALGDYKGAIRDAQEAIGLRRALKDAGPVGDDLNTLGRAYQYSGNYSAALESYQGSIQEHRSASNTAGEITLLNNIGNVFYFQGRYLDALHSYHAALEKVN